MVRFSAEDFRRILTKIRGLKARVYFYFKDFKYLLTIDGLVRARDKNFDVVSWSIVFGSKAPHEVLNSLNVEKVEVELKGELNPLIFNSIEEFLKWLTQISS